MTDFSEYNEGRQVCNEDPFPYFDPEVVFVKRPPEFPAPPGFDDTAPPLIPPPPAAPLPPDEAGSLGDFSPATLAGSTSPLDIILKCGALQAFQDYKHRQVLEVPSGAGV